MRSPFRPRAAPQPPESWIAQIPVRGRRARVLRGWITPARLLLLSFAGLILTGTLALRFLPGIYTGARLSWTDALFTATSAVCVTGLIVVDTATHFTPLGQALLLVLIQLGGLGILTLATVVILAMGRRISFHHRVAAAQGSELIPDVDFRHVLTRVVLFTLLFEAAGALLLFLGWLGTLGAGDALWAATFHSVSAFCNAGFSVFSDSLVGFATSPAILLAVMALVVAGGLGFITLTELHAVAVQGRELPRRRVSLQTRLVLGTTVGLLLAGWILFAVLEWRGALEGMAWPHRVLNALFMSVTPRTAGFNTVDYADVSPGTSMVTMLLMSIGGSPGSTAGGMKTTTFAVLLLAAWARLRGRHEVVVGGRAVTADALERSLVLWVAGSVVLASAMLVLAFIQLGDGSRFLSMLFEAVSAFNTVGLSMGTTAELGGPAKLVVIGLMYLGRVGPLATAAALVPVSISRRDLIRHAREDLIVG